jgi:C1A family cysteine protease
MAKRATRAKGSSQDNAADQIRPTKAGRRPRKKEGARGATAGRTFGAYGWVPDLPDHRDLMYSAPLGVIGSIPKKIDLRPHCPPVVDQGQLGSCTGNAIAGAHQFDQLKQGLLPAFAPSRLFIYYNERVMEGTVNEDAGAMIRDGIKTIGKQGVCPETNWPYIISKFTQKPPASCFTIAKKHCAVQYRRIARTLPQMKGCLAEGYPFVFGFSVYASFEDPQVAKTGIVPLPDPTEELLGGHAVLAVGYDDAKHVFIVRNSWGTGWGMKGYFTMPYGYLLDSNLADDFWTVRMVQ